MKLSPTSTKNTRNTYDCLHFSNFAVRFFRNIPPEFHFHWNIFISHVWPLHICHVLLVNFEHIIVTAKYFTAVSLWTCKMHLKTSSSDQCLRQFIPILLWPLQFFWRLSYPTRGRPLASVGRLSIQLYWLYPSIFSCACLHWLECTYFSGMN